MWYETVAGICYATTPSGFIMESKNLNSRSPVKISPNPFRNSAIIYYSVAFSTMVYDISGKPLRTLSGQDRMDWDGKGGVWQKSQEGYLLLFDRNRKRKSK